MKKFILSADAYVEVPKYRKKRVSKPSTSAIRYHARFRARQRYGIDYNRTMRLAIKAMIRDQQDAAHVDRGYDGAARWALVIDERPVIVVWKKCRREVLTFLPPQTLYDHLFDGEARDDAALVARIRSRKPFKITYTPMED